MAYPRCKNLTSDVKQNNDQDNKEPRSNNIEEENNNSKTKENITGS